MRLRDFLIFLLSTLFCQGLSAQKSPLSVKITSPGQRTLVQVQAGKNQLQLCGFLPGGQYQVVAAVASADQKLAFKLQMDDPEQENAAQAFSPAQRPQLRKFTAASECVDFTLDVATKGPEKEGIPIYLSVTCYDCPREDGWMKSLLQEVANLSVVEGGSADMLVRNVLVGGDCFQVSNVQSKGNSKSRGTFSNGQSNINLASGMLLCTGLPSLLPGPNNFDNTSGGFSNSIQNDPDVAKLTNGDQFDVSAIEFDFIPTTNKVQFDFVFGSEEYCEYVGSAYNDAFGFFLSGPGIAGKKNIALIPNTNIPVAINNVNHLTNAAFYRNNNDHWALPPLANCLGSPMAAPAECELDGFTTVMTAMADLIPCQTYHIKLVIADITDEEFASAVFFRANSFNAGGQANAAPVYPAGAQGHAIEGCDKGFIRFSRSGDLSKPLNVTYSIAANSTAQAGVDYAALPGSITIPAGQTEVLVPVTIFDDQLAEDQEFFTILLDQACSCQQQQIDFIIDEKMPLDLNMLPVAGCAGVAELIPELLTAPGIPPLTYSWSSGTSNPTYLPTQTGAHTYTVTVTDGCGQTGTATAQATIDEIPTALLSGDGFFCPGGSTTLSLNFTGAGPWTVGLQGTGLPPTQQFTNNPSTITVSQGGIYSVTSVVSANGCPGTASGSAQVQEVTLGVSLTGTNPACHGSVGSIQSVVSTNAPQYTFAWSNNTSAASLSNVTAGTYTLTVTTSQGCSTVSSTTLTEPQALSAMLVQANEITCLVLQSNVTVTAQGGTPGYQYLWENGTTSASNIFSAGGTYTVSITDANLCATVFSVNVPANTTPPGAVAAALNEITCNTSTANLSSAGSSSGSNFTYLWTAADGHAVTNPNSPGPTVDVTGIYQLLVTNTLNGCTATAQTEVKENTDYPTAMTFQVTQPGCEGKPGSFSIQAVEGGKGPYVFSIDGGTTFANKLTFGGLPAGNYTVIVQDANGCEYEQDVDLIAPVEPDLYLGPDVKLEFGATTELVASLNIPLSEVDTIVWTPAEAVTPTNSIDKVLVQPFKYTQYSVLVIAKNGCEDRASLAIRVDDPHIYAPNAIDPTAQDAENDIFRLYASSTAVREVKRLQVFDRWGNLVFARDHFDLNDDARRTGWDGSFRGKLLGPGVFTWWAEVELASGEPLKLKGDVAIIR